jgi:hypothetical protein
MKKQFLWVILPLLVSSCATAGTFKGGTIYDESLPLEESAVISIHAFGTITGYNGITVLWKQVWGKASNIQIPAGDTLLEVDVDSTPGNVRYTGKGLIFQYNFQAGKYYYLTAGIDEKTKDFGVRVYSWDKGEKMVTVAYTNFEAFTPFLNAEGNIGVGEQIILE